LKSRGMNPPQLAIGDGAMGFWASLDEIYPKTRQQRCWMHYANFRIMPTSRRQPLLQVAIVAMESA